MKRLTFYFLSIFIASACFAQSNMMEADGSIKLPAEKMAFQGNYSVQKTKSYNDLGKLKSRIQSASDLIVIKDNNTGGTRLGMGSPIQIQAVNVVNKDNIVRVSLDFVKSRADLFKTGPGDEIRFVNSAEALGKFYVNLSQYHDGLELLLSKINLVISPAGKVVSFTSSVYDNITYESGFSSDETIISGATKGLEIDKNLDKITIDPGNMILPIVSDGGVIYKMVRRVEIHGSGKSFTAYIDAVSGEPLWRINNIISSTNIQILSNVRISAKMPTINIPANDMYVKIGTKQYMTDSTGQVRTDDNAAVTGTVAFQGKWAGVFVLNSNYKLDTTKVLFSLTPGKDTVIGLNDNNVNYAIRNSYYYANKCHEYITRIDPGFKALDYQLPILIQYSGSPNGLSDGVSIRLTGVSSDLFKVANAPLVIDHEYGHTINAKFYKWRGLKDGMVNLSCNEGTADIHAGLMENESDPTKGIIDDPTKYPGMQRYLTNKCIYPDSLSGDSHISGRILAGAIWDLRVAIGLDKVRKLAHYARYSLPDDMNIGLAFSEWYLAFLLADDDDDDLSNGTPHFDEIQKAFNDHKIGEPLMIAYRLRHDEMADLPKYEANSKINITGIYNNPLNKTEYGLKSLAMKMRIEPNSEVYSVPMAQTNDSIYSATISAPDNCALIRFYFEGIQKKGNNIITCYKNYVMNNEYDVLLGYKSCFVDKCESQNGWDFYDNNDYASYGKWTMADPSQIASVSLPSPAPKSNHSNGGKYCFATGVFDKNQDFISTSLQGLTTLTTPELNFSKYGKRFAIRFYYWCYKYHYVGEDKGVMYLNISTDGGSTWKVMDELRNATPQWERKTYALDKYVSDPDSMRNVKFSFKAYNNNQYPLNYCATRFIIDDLEILTDAGEIGVGEEKSGTAGELFAYPNPVVDGCYIKFNPGMENYSLTLIDALGRELQTIQKGMGNGNYEEILWTPDKLSAGSYFIKMNSGNSPSILPIIKK